jgi:hypothetical protein
MPKTRSRNTLLALLLPRFLLRFASIVLWLLAKQGLEVNELLDQR